MLLFQKRFHEGLTSGAITLTFRAWDKPRVKPGGRYRCHPIGVLEVDSIRRVSLKEIRESDAERAGFASRAELLGYLAPYLATGSKDEVDPNTELWRVELHHGGDGDRVETALEDQLTTGDVEEIRRRLARLDAREPWTLETLRLIEKQPRVAASRLAAKLGRETAPFKVDVRKLKKLGLTQSFEIGYEVSPRGRAYLRAIGTRRRR
ncbi:MAG TPA: ASCH domain-containing protein [Planctomycetota bacterium]|nr:ASCH domain-containing protein [Planctomycetota bacterium]